MTHPKVFVGVAAFAAMTAGVADATILQYASTLRGSYEVPKNATHGSGLFRGVLDTDTGSFTYTVNYSGLSGPGIAAQFVGPAATEPAQTPLADPINGVVKLTPAQMRDLNAGRWYFDIRTAAYPNGEIRGELIRNDE
jgi:hypothetical protein